MKTILSRTEVVSLEARFVFRDPTKHSFSLGLFRRRCGGEDQVEAVGLCVALTEQISPRLEPPCFFLRRGRTVVEWRCGRLAGARVSCALGLGPICNVGPGCVMGFVKLWLWAFFNINSRGKKNCCKKEENKL